MQAQRRENSRLAVSWERREEVRERCGQGSGSSSSTGTTSLAEIEDSVFTPDTDDHGPSVIIYGLVSKSLNFHIIP